jgi:hypothetical protein
LADAVFLYAKNYAENNIHNPILLTYSRSRKKY